MSARPVLSTKHVPGICRDPVSKSQEKKGGPKRYPIKASMPFQFEKWYYDASNKTKLITLLGMCPSHSVRQEFVLI